MRMWDIVIPMSRANVLVHNTKIRIEFEKRKRNEEAQKNAAKKQTKVVFRLPSYFLICKNCEVVLEYSPSFTESAWSGVELVHCCECGRAMRVSG